TSNLRLARFVRSVRSTPMTPMVGVPWARRCSEAKRTRELPASFSRRWSLCYPSPDVPGPDHRPRPPPEALRRGGGREALARQVGRPRRARLRRDTWARGDIRRRHAASHRVGLAARRPRLQLHADRRGRALPPHAWPQRLLSHGMGRQRPADRTARADPLSRAVRSEGPPGAGAAPRTSDAGGAEGPAAGGVASRLHRALPAAHARGRAGVPGAVAADRAVGRLA